MPTAPFDMEEYNTPDFTRYATVHAKPTHGPGDIRPTALQIIQDNDLEGALSDKVILITGCSSGIGIETARALSATGAHIYCTARDLEKGKIALSSILSLPNVHLMHLDLDSLSSVRSFANDFLTQTSNKINILIANAGIMAVPESVTQDGFERQFGVNHLAHFLLFQLLKPALLASSTPTFHSRVVCVSSMGHRYACPNLDNIQLRNGAYTPNAAYGHAKTANIWMANSIERHFGSCGLHAYSLHPGGIVTGLQDHLKEQMAKWKDDPNVLAYMKSGEQGAATTVWAAVGKVWEGRGGRYLEDCQVCPPCREGYELLDWGFETWAYDEVGEERLWEMSCEMVGVGEKGL